MSADHAGVTYLRDIMLFYVVNMHKMRQRFFAFYYIKHRKYKNEMKREK